MNWDDGWLTSCPSFISWIHMYMYMYLIKMELHLPRLRKVELNMKASRLRYMYIWVTCIIASRLGKTKLSITVQYNVVREDNHKHCSPSRNLSVLISAVTTILYIYMCDNACSRLACISSTNNIIYVYLLYMHWCSSTQLYAENETLRQKIIELEKRLESKEYFAMMYKIVCDDNTKES